MFLSKYTYQFANHGKYYIYNSLSNCFAELDKETYAMIKEARDENNFSVIDAKMMPALKKMKVVVENDKDEINKIKYLNSLRRSDDRNLFLTINPTLSCNFNCPYCFEQEHQQVFMSDQTEDKIVDFIKSHVQVKTVSITWFGGEPLLAFDRIASLTKKVQCLGKRYAADMITNGYLLSEKIISQLPSLSISSLQITLDGLAPLHDSRRCLKSGKPTFERILQNIDMLQKKCPKISIKVRVNVDKTNVQEFLKLHKLFEDRHYPNLRVNLAFVKDITGCKGCPSFYNADQQAAIVKKLLLHHGLDFSMVFPVSGRNECFIRNKNALVIGPEGELYKCWNDVGNKDKVFGYVDGRITNEPLLLRYLVAADPFEDPKCQKCLLLPVCDGGCPYSRIQNEYEGTDIDTCLYMKRHLEEFLVAHAEYKERFCK